jgi:multiple RNA-binding domain-containing protein 1
MHISLLMCVFLFFNFSIAEDPKLQEFLSLMKPRVNQAIWTNDDDINVVRGQQQSTIATAAPPIVPDYAGAAAPLADGDGSEDDLYEDIPIAMHDPDDNFGGNKHKINNANAAKRRGNSNMRGHASDADASASEDDDDEARGGTGASTLDPVVAAANVTDLEYLRSRVRKNFDDDDDALADMKTRRTGAREVADVDGVGKVVGGEEVDEAQKKEKKKRNHSESEPPIHGGDEDMEEFEEDGRGKQRGAAKDSKPCGNGDTINAIFAGKTDSEGLVPLGKDPRTAVASQDDGGDDDDDAALRGNNQHVHHQPENADPQAEIRETGRLFIRNLPYTASEDDLRSLFEAFGDVADAHVVLDKLTRKSKGFALIRFGDPEAAVAAFNALDGSIFMGRLLHILPGKHAPSSDYALHGSAAAEDDGNIGEGDGDGDEEGATKRGGNSSYKRQREAALKASAATNTSAWNALFMRADTVAAAVAAHYGVTKADLLDPSAPDMAVRLALGETQVIAETKAALEEVGVDVASLEKAAAQAGARTKKATSNSNSNSGGRSTSVLLVKNLPFTADDSELTALFSAYGQVARMVLPPTKTLALVEFVEPQDARAAFKGLAYKRYQSVPLYLEWAPSSVFNRPLASQPQEEERKDAQLGDSSRLVSPSTIKRRSDERGDAAAVDVMAELATAASADEAVATTTIYVKNLSFESDETALTAHVQPAVEAAGGSLRSVKIARRKAKDGRVLSSGFGFVECSSESVARDVIKALQGTTLGGHRLVLQLAIGGYTEQSRGNGGAAAGGLGSSSAGDAGTGRLTQSQSHPQGKDGTKIVVRNVAFEATRKDVLGLFSPFGAVTSCRLPRKFDGTHRGFAFVEFATRQEAKAAVGAVSGTHLYGRRLVIEWAEADGGLEDLRAKTALRYRGEAGALAGTGKRKKATAEEDAGEEDDDEDEVDLENDVIGKAPRSGQQRKKKKPRKASDVLSSGKSRAKKSASETL